MSRKANHLIGESSPYLKQHAYNPVNWFPWGKDALELAKRENKLIFISIGYSACHWCHVMERESFSNESIAKILNDHYISIKIDREERPDLDQTYMSAVQLMSGSGGWPLSCFATPEGKPFYGGTYYHPDQFTNILDELQMIWFNNPEKIQTHADGLCEGIKNSTLIQEKSQNEGISDIGLIYNKLKSDFDTEYGGFNRVPKFPMPSVYLFLLRYYYYSRDESSLRHVITTLDRMISGGMYDQVGGGIARYSTDKYWHVPHFEKMLYDNAQFISLLSDAYSLTKSEIYLEKLYQTAGFLERELHNGNGGYFSSIDADSDGDEGKFYIWKEKEIQEIAGRDQSVILSYYGITPRGNWEAGKNILKAEGRIDIIAKETGQTAEEISAKLKKINNLLLEHRNQRVRPDRDEKVLTSWNSLLIKAFSEAYQATGDEGFKMKAIRSGQYILDNMLDADFMLYRSDDRKIPGFLDDYAFVAKSFIFLYQITFDESWLERTKDLLSKIFTEFYDEHTGMFYYSPESAANPVTRQLELTDNVIPSSNSALAKVLFYASVYFDNPEFRNIARQMLVNIQPHLIRSPSYFSNWLSLLLMFQADFSEVVITGMNYQEIRKDFCGHFHPHVIFAGTNRESGISLFRGRTGNPASNIYVCQNKTCKMPVQTAKEALDQLKL
ncbi:MAG: thioredoxin domain-containing protein [Bacteroidales bacterium]|nr:thioredoxin domain-containing protein [Bacteroidales bacterium]